MSISKAVEEYLKGKGYRYYPDLCVWCSQPLPKDDHGNDMHFMFPPFGITDERIVRYLNERSITSRG